MVQFVHRPVLLEPTVESLVGVQYGRRGSHALDELPDQQARLSGVYVDGTFGRGGHSHALLARLNRGFHIGSCVPDKPGACNDNISRL